MNFFYSWVILHCVYIPQLSYPFICWWTSRLLPCASYCKQWCDEHWGTRVSFNSGFFGVYAQQWDCWVIWQFYFQFFKGIFTLFSILAILVCIPTNSVGEFPFLHTLSLLFSFWFIFSLFLFWMNWLFSLLHFFYSVYLKNRRYLIIPLMIFQDWIYQTLLD